LSYGEAADLYHGIGDLRGVAVVAYDLGSFYSRIRNLGEANVWYKQSLNMTDLNDHHDRAKCVAQLGHVAYMYFEDAVRTRRHPDETWRFLAQAQEHYLEALRMFPRDAISDLAAVHLALGRVYGYTGNIALARKHFSEGIGDFERTDDMFGAAEARLGFALVLANADHFDEAKTYAESALRTLKNIGDGSADLRQEIQRVLAQIATRLRPTVDDDARRANLIIVDPVEEP
jgi:tetratricopeptide (TPR) repeat protein